MPDHTVLNRGWGLTRVVVMLAVAGCTSAGRVCAGFDPPPPPASSASSSAPSIPGRPREVTAEQAEKERKRLEKLVFAAFDAKEYAAAEAGLRELIPYDGDNFVPWYNLACALALQGKADEGMKMLDQSIARGFSDRRQMESDPNLAAVRETDRYKALLLGWDRLLEKRSEANLELARKTFTTEATAKGYSTERDERLHLAYLSAFDARLFEEAKGELALLSGWWDENVAPEPAGEGEEAGGAGGSGAAVVPWVTVVLPARADYARWAQRRFGDAWERVGGQYSHDNKLLVAQDLGASLRHEYWHVLHWRDQDARGQRHPMWIMEGLCSLVEDAASTAPGSAFRPVASWRTNMARRLARGGALMPWETMFALDGQGFHGTRPLAQYAQARSIFLYLFERGKLRAWYGAYVRGYEEDATGARALAGVLGKPIKEAEKDFRAWLRALPEVQDEVGRGPANLPFEVGPGAGDGPTVDAPIDLRLTGPGARGLGGPGGLQNRDVITAIDGKPVRDLNELARLLGGYQPGASVEVEYRRKDRHGAVKVVLVPPR